MIGQLYSKMIKRAFTRRAIEDEEGAVAVEFALTLPIYLALIGLIVEGSWMIYHQQAVNFAAQQASRHALVNYNATEEQIRAVAKSNLELLDTANLAADAIVIDSIANPDGTKEISIKITYNYDPLYPMMDVFLDTHNDGFAFTAESSGFLVTALDPVLLSDDEVVVEEEV